MKKIVSMFVLALSTAMFAQAPAKQQTPAPAFKTFGEAMNAGKAAWDVGRPAEMATYKARNQKNKAEAAKQEKIWRENYLKGAAAYAEAAKLAPNPAYKARALREAANCAVRINDRAKRAEGLAMMKQSYELLPNDGQTVYTYGWMLTNSGKPAEACAVAEKYLADKNLKKPFAVSVVTDWHIGSLLALKRFDDAKKLNAELVKVAPKYNCSKRIDAAVAKNKGK